MEKQEGKKPKLMACNSTCSGVRSTPPTRADSADAGEVGPADGGVVDGFRASGSSQCDPPVLPERLERSFDDRRKKRLLLGTQRMPEVGGGVHCSLDWMEASGGFLDAQ